MHLLELFAGTKSVGKVADELGWDVVSLDLQDATINCNILDWDYTQYAPGTFDVIWASPPCNTFSCARQQQIGRNGYTKESLQHDIEQIGLPLLHKTLEIISYFEPKYWFIENPQTGSMKNICNNMIIMTSIIVSTAIGAIENAPGFGQI